MRAFVKERLEAEGMTVRDVARAGGVAHATIAGVLAGDAKPGLRFYVVVSKALGVPIEQLLELAGEIPPGPREDATLAEIMEIARHLTADQVRALRDYARFQSEQGRGRGSRRAASRAST